MKHFFILICLLLVSSTRSTQANDVQKVLPRFLISASSEVKQDRKEIRRLEYSPRDYDAATAWQKQVRAELVELLLLKSSLADREQWDLGVKVLSTTEQPGYLLREVTFNSTPNQRINALVTLPLGLGTGLFPAVVCIHGHSSNRRSVYESDTIYHGFAARLAAMGMVTVAVDVGQHEVRNPDTTLMGERLFDLIRCVDYLESIPEVDPKRIGCAGLSLGGEMAMWLGAVDLRIRAVVSAGFLTVMDQLEQNHCLCWKFDGLRERVDFADIYALIAPRALLCQIGEQEPPSQFNKVLAKQAFSEIYRIYADKDAPKKARLHIHPGGHEMHLPTLSSFLLEILGTSP